MAVAKVLSAWKIILHYLRTYNAEVQQHKSTGYMFNNCVVNFNIQIPPLMNSSTSPLTIETQGRPED